jgi:hypothetical protein
MRRSSAKNLSLIFVAVLLVALTACGGGGGSSSGTPSTIVLSTTTATLKQGDVFQISATVEDSSGNALTSFTPSFSVTSGGNLVSVSVNGLVCGGHWDSLTTPVNCTPPPLDSSGKPTPAGRATITVSVNAVTSTLTVDVVPTIDNLTIVAAPVTQDAANTDCVSQFGTRNYTVTATNKGVPVDLSAVKTDAITWSINSTVGTIAPLTDTTTSVTDSTVGVATAKIPGRTTVTAGLFSLSGTPWVKSSSANFTTCPVSTITIADATGVNVSPAPLAPAGTVTLTPAIKDSRGNDVSLTDPSNSNASLFSLLWNTSQPSVAGAASTGTVTAGASTGISSIVAACVPPGCNAGLGSVYSNLYLAKVTGTTTTRTVYIGSATPTAGLTLLPMNTADSTFGTAITLGDVPNSMLFDASGSNLYIGTNSGLIVVSTTAGTATAPGTGIPGKVLAFSPDGSVLLASNSSVVSDPTKSQVFAYFPSSGTFQTLNVHGAVAAAFSPDSSTAYIVGSNTLSVYSGGTITATIPMTGAQSASFLASGALGYIAANGSGLGSNATCNRLDEGVITTSGTPTLVGTLVGTPDGATVAEKVVAVAAPKLDLVNLAVDNTGFANPTNGCAPLPPTLSKPTDSVPVNAAPFTPKQLIVTPDGSAAYVLSDVASLLGISTGIGTGAAPVSAPIPLSGGAIPTTGGVTIDSKQIFVGGSDGKIHRIDLSASPATDTPIALPSTAPTGFTPDFVLVQPR